MVDLNIPKLLDIFGIWLNTLGNFWVTLNTPINAVFEGNYSLSLSLVVGFLNLVGAGNLTILEFIVGPAVAFFVVWTLLTWFLNFIT